MNALTFRLRLLEPVLVSQAEGGEENSAVGLSFIPGSALRGVLVNRYLSAHPTSDLAGDEQARRLFLDGTVCFLNAYPWRENSRLLPRPMSWFTEKNRADDEDAQILDGAVTSIQPLKQPKAPGGEFCYLADDAVALCISPRQINIHTAIIDPNQRDEQNTVYRYDALAEGEALAGVVLSADQAALDEIAKLLTPDEIQIGRAHKVGYGRAKIEAVERPTYWQEYLPGDDPEEEQVVVTLLSDAILRGKNGQVDGDLDAVLKAKKDPQTYRRLRLVGGFNRKWSLPLTQTWALQAGSVYVYPAGAVDLAALRALEQRGIGERRAEGFGRIAVNWHTQPVLKRYGFERHYPAVQELSQESQKMAGQMAQRRLRLLLDRKLAETVSIVTLTRRPQNTQLSRVRNVVQQALASKDLKLVVEHLGDLKGAREQFERARVQDTPLLGWIEARAKNRDVDKELLQSAALPRVAGVSADLTEELKTEYTGRLIDGVMKKAIKQNQEEAAG
jgi:CRISPR-associated protein Csx10